VDAIRREACDGLTAATLAKRFPVSRKLFELRFREAIGHSVLNEILHVRMERVFDLLARQDFPIGAIADFCGFDSARELRSLFRKRMGTSMREWRNMRL
jgi:LacI family transcriptional regulator